MADEEHAAEVAEVAADDDPADATEGSAAATAAPRDRSRLVALAADVPWPGTGSRELPDGYGRLVDLAAWLDAVRGTDAPPLARPRALVLAAEPAAVAAEIAAQHGLGIRTVEAPAVEPDAFGDLVAAGAAIVDDEVEAGAGLFVIARPETTAAAAAIVAVLTNTEPVKVMARGAAATDPELWMRRAAEVRDLRRRGFPHRNDPDELLTEIGTPDLALAAGLIAQAAVRRTPVLLDGPAAVAAGLLAYEAQPRIVRWVQVADSAPEPALELAVTTLGLRPLLAQGVATGDGTAGALCLPLLRAAETAATQLTSAAQTAPTEAPNESAGEPADVAEA